MSSQEALQAILRKLKRSPNVPDDDALDELVHDAKSGEASSINNEGLESQLAYLLGDDREVDSGTYREICEALGIR